MRRNKSFLGTGWSFPPRFDEEMEDMEMVSDDQDIRESLFLLMSTNPGERVTNPKYGCDLHRFAFRPIDKDMEDLMEEIIRRAVKRYEPRVEVESVLFDTTSELEGLIEVTLSYRIITTNVRTNIVFPFYKVEGTEVREV